MAVIHDPALDLPDSEAKGYSPAINQGLRHCRKMQTWLAIAPDTEKNQDLKKYYEMKYRDLLRKLVFHLKSITFKAYDAMYGD